MKSQCNRGGIALCVSSLFVWSACGDDEAKPGPDSSSTKLVASKGGSAKSADGGLELIVWPGALSQDATVIIETGIPSPAPVATIGALYRIRLEPPATTVSDAQITFFVLATSLGNTNPQYDLRVGHRLTQSGPFGEVLKGDYDPGSYTIIVNSLYDFALIDEQVYRACLCALGTCNQGTCAEPAVVCGDEYTPPPWSSDGTCDGGSCASWSPTSSLTELDAIHSLYVQPHVAVDANGTPWLTYTSAGTDDLDIFLVKLDTAGAVTFGPIQVNTTDAAGQNEPRIAVRGDGSGIVCWGSSNDVGNQGFARTFDASGTLGPEHEIVMGAKSVWRPACAVFGDGYVAAGDRGNDAENNNEIWVTALDLQGAPIGDAVRVSQLGDNYETDGTVTRSELAVDANGSIGVSWQRLFVDKASVRFLNCGLRPLSYEIDLGTLVLGDFASVASLGQGFLVAWSDPQTSSKSRIMGRVYDSSGMPSGGNVQLTEEGSGLRVTPVASCVDATTCSLIWMTVSGNAAHRWIDLGGGGHGSETTLTSNGQPNYLVSTMATHYGAWFFWVENSPYRIRGASVALP